MFVLVFVFAFVFVFVFVFMCMFVFAIAFVFVFLFICPVAVMLFTAHRVGVRTEGRNLVISGYFRTTRIDVDEIQDFRLVKLHSQPAALCVIQKTGDVTGLPSGGQVFWGIGRGAVEERAERLRSWRRSVG